MRLSPPPGFVWLTAALLAGSVDAGGADCNGNGQLDSADIETGASADCNENQVPDECETAPLWFGGSSEIFLGSSPRSFLTGDFTGDGLRDIAYGCSRPRKKDPVVVVIEGHGEDGFAEVEPPSGSLLARIVAGDFDGDGGLDAAAADSSSVWVFLNAGRTDSTATFGLPRRVTDSDGLAGLAAGDLNSDGFADLILTRRPNDVAQVLLGSRDGGLPEAGAYPAGAAPGAVVLLDLDRDSDLDAAVLSQESGNIQLVLNDGKGKLTASARLGAAGARAEMLAAADFGGDGWPDLAAASRFSLAVLRNTERGLGDAAPFALEKAGLPIRALFSGDPDHDGDIDIALGLSSPPGILFVLNRGDGVFNASFRQGLTAPIIAAALADLTGDGADDLVLSVLSSSGLRVLRNGAGEAQGEASPDVSFTLERVYLGFEPHSSALEDLDGDHDLDMAVIDGETDINILKNSGQETLTFQRSYHVRDSLEMISLHAADFDGDHDIDLATADEYTARVLVLLNNGKGVFGQTGSHRVGERPTHLTSGDVTGDSHLDLICVDQGNNTLSILDGKGDGKFREAWQVQVRQSPNAAAPGDFDGDGNLDIAVAGYGSSEVQVLFGGGKKSFTRRRSFPVKWPTWVTAADFDGDGKLDIAATSYGPRQIQLLWNNGGGELEQERPLATEGPAYTLISPDFTGDGRPDLVASSTSDGSVSLFVNLGARSFSSASSFPVGADPRFAVCGDLDGDADADIVTANHTSLDLTVLHNEARRVAAQAYMTRICTEAEFYNISLPSAESRGGQGVVRQTKFVLPAVPGDASLLPAVFQDVKREPLHQQFLAQTFPERFPALGAEAYDALTGRRATRKYWSGILRRIKTDKGIAYGFSLLGDFADDPAELPTVSEVEAAFRTLSDVFALRPLEYYPESEIARADAARWESPGFRVHNRPVEKETRYVPYTRSTAYGRVRVLTLAAFQEMNGRGSLSYQDILVLDHAPRDIEGVVAGVITSEPQGELSHLALRTARRGTPNAFLSDAMTAFAALDGKLIRLDVGESTYKASEALPEEASAAWETHRPHISLLPIADLGYGGLDSLFEMQLDSSVPPQARYGGKASNFARLQRILDGPFLRYRERGFAVPMRYYFEFLQSNLVPSAVDPSLEIPADQFLVEVADWPAFQSDSRLRFEVLARFRERLEAAGEVDPDLVARIARRVREVFDSAETPVRFRSSSNVEDALEFNGAGLYDSTSACAADDQDGDEEGPSHCDSTRPAERGIARALKRVWMSLWNFRAYEERAYYGIPQENAAMAVFVSRAYPDELANGVALTGSAQSADDRRYVVTAQVGEESVVSPEPGLLPEKDLLTVSDGEVTAVARPQLSTLVTEGELVLSHEQLEELGALLSYIDRHLPMNLEGHRRQDVLLDFEFKINASGCVAVKQVRPFLRLDAAAPAPLFELDVPAGAEACGAFVPSRAPRRAYELKAGIRFRPGKHIFPAGEEPSPAELIDELVVGPERRPAVSRGPGSIQEERAAVRRSLVRESAAGDGGPTNLEARRFRYQQSFELPGGVPAELEMLFELGGETGDPRGVVLDEEYIGRKLALQVSSGSVISFSSCSGERLQLWDVRARFADGSAVRILERHDPPPTPNDTGPAVLGSAEVDLLGERRDVEDYWNLVYTSLRHNRAVRYWVVFEPPLAPPMGEQPVKFLELVAPEPKLGVKGEARLYAADFSPLAAIAVASYDRRLEQEALPLRYLRGDANGDGSFNAADAVRAIEAVFFCAADPMCESAADRNGDGAVEPFEIALLVSRLFEVGGFLADAPGQCISYRGEEGAACRPSASCW